MNTPAKTLRAAIASACALTLLLSPAAPASRAAESPPSRKPVFLYCRAFNAQGESRYLPNGSFSQILDKLREEFEVRVETETPTADSLKDVNVILIANPSDKAVGKNPPPRHITDADAAVLEHFVNHGGGLIIMGNQENHNLETVDVNRLMTRFGLQFTNLYTDVKELHLPAETPVIGGLRWGYYTGDLVLVSRDHPAQPRALVMNDLSQKPINGSRDARGALLGVAEPGKGRVELITDSGWISNDVLDGKGIGGVAVKGQDNWEIFRRLAHWAARK